jgi:hypothetical protein
VASAAAVAALLLVTGPLSDGTPAGAATAPQIVAGEITQGSSGNLTGMCLDDKQGSAADGNSIDLYPCNDAWSSQLWTVEADGPATEAASAANGLQLMYNENTGLFDNNCGDPSNPCCTNNKGNCWWWSANELCALIDYFEQQGTVSFPGAGAYLSDISNTYANQSTFLNGAYDDEAW